MATQQHLKLGIGTHVEVQQKDQPDNWRLGYVTAASGTRIKVLCMKKNWPKCQCFLQVTF
jgi:hypothetical protein